jgi:uncharacterized damage-inducible protein DinB
MADVNALDLVRGLYDYHRWANRRLYDVAAGLGQAMADREVGPQFSAPTLTKMFAHLYGADAVWLTRWEGSSPTAMPGGDITSLAQLRPRWDALEARQRAFLDALTPAGLARVIEYKNTEGKPFRLALWPLLQHVANHATHHRSEIATMMTMLSGSPPDSGIALYHLVTSHQMA